MAPTRRFVTLGIAATLAGCGGVARAPVAERAAFRPVPNPAFDAWVAAFRGRARAAGIAEATLDRAFRGVGFLPEVIERDRNQAEFSRSLEDYLALTVSEDRVRTGRAELARRRALFGEIEARYGVDAPAVAAIWGVESNFGARRGAVPVISALATLAHDGRRGAFFERQLIAALRILENGDVTPERMTGSWAGAMGHTQFIPTSYRAYAVDFRGDGRRDIWSDDPTDGLASAAAYLSRAGWRRGRPWGAEVRLPAGFDTALAGRGRTRSVADWAARGVTAVGGGPPPDHGPAALLIPSGPRGPAFLAFRNFEVITRYNNAESYAIAVGHLAERLAGGPPIRTPFPPDAAGMTIDDRRRLQRRLTAAGFDAGGADGVIGPDTRAAIRAYQESIGQPATGEPSLALLRRLG